MSLRFWTTLQMLKQAVLVENGSIERGLTTADSDWNVREDIVLPSPYKFAFMERRK